MSSQINCREFPEELLQTLPPSKISGDCGDGDFGCGHWVHRTVSPEGNAIFSDEFSRFLDGQLNMRGGL